MPIDHFLQQHSGSLTIVILTALVLGTLLLVVPQLLRAHLQVTQLRHEQIMRALDQGHPLPTNDDRTQFAGRTAVLVPLVAIISAGAVTCFVAVYKVDTLFSVTLAVWTVAGVTSLAAITGGMALMTQALAGLSSDQETEEPSDEPVGSGDRT